MFNKLFVCAAVFVQLALSQDDISGRIVGGVSTDISLVPYQVGVFVGPFLCGGSVVTTRAVITAAHCTAKSDEYRRAAKIRAGSTYYYKGGQERKVFAIYDHPSYNPSYSAYDISVLIVDVPLVFDSNVQPINLPMGVTNSGDIVTVSGWGRTIPDDPKSVSETVRYLNVPFINSNDCKNSYYGASITKDMVCAGYINKSGYDSCQGDSGGPLVRNGVLVGVVSWGDGCAKPGFPGVYADVFYFKNFITDVIQLF